MLGRLARRRFGPEADLDLFNERFVIICRFRFVYNKRFVIYIFLTCSCSITLNVIGRSRGVSKPRGRNLGLCGNRARPFPAAIVLDATKQIVCSHKYFPLSPAGCSYSSA